VGVAFFADPAKWDVPTRPNPLDLPDPVEAIKYTMESKGLTIKDLEPMIGRSNRVYVFLSCMRPLTLKMIWDLHRRLGNSRRIPSPSIEEWLTPGCHADVGCFRRR